MKLSMPIVPGTTVAAALLISGVVAAQTTNTGNICINMGNTSSSITVEITLVCATVAG